MAQSRHVIGLLGGTFDPIHNGHIESALAVAKALTIDDMRLMPNGRPPHRQTPLLPPAVRLQALNLALSAQPNLSLELSEWNATVNQPDTAGYTVNSLQRLRALYPDASLVFVMGADAYAAIESWHDYQKLPELSHLLVTTRPGYSFNFQGVAADWLRDKCPNNECNIRQHTSGTVQTLTIADVDVSATRIRERLQQGKLPSQWVPPAIIPILESQL